MSRSKKQDKLGDLPKLVRPTTTEPPPRPAAYRAVTPGAAPAAPPIAQAPALSPRAQPAAARPPLAPAPGDATPAFADPAAPPPAADATRGPTSSGSSPSGVRSVHVVRAGEDEAPPPSRLAGFFGGGAAPTPARVGADQAAAPYGTFNMADIALSERQIRRVADYGPERRAAFDASIRALADDIRANGLLHPIAIRRADHRGVKFEVLIGERRFRACQFLGWQTIWGRLSDEGADREWAQQFAENMQREPLSPMEEALALDEARARFAALAGESEPFSWRRLKQVPEIQAAYRDRMAAIDQFSRLANLPANAQQFLLNHPELELYTVTWKLRRLSTPEYVPALEALAREHATAAAAATAAPEEDRTDGGGAGEGTAEAEAATPRRVHRNRLLRIKDIDVFRATIATPSVGSDATALSELMIRVVTPLPKAVLDGDEAERERQLIAAHRAAVDALQRALAEREARARERGWLPTGPLA